MFIRFLIGFFCFFAAITLVAQDTPYVYGRITDFTGQPMAGVNVYFSAGNVYGTTTDANGYYKVFVPKQQILTIKFSFTGYKTEETQFWLEYGQIREINAVLYPDDKLLNTQLITAKSRKAAAVTKIDPKDVKTIASVGGGITPILRTMPGVVSNNELSQQYSVRGGNFDENLVYVNDFEVYRPFLIRAGQQEGLGFINTDMVSNINFSSGGFEAKYGDKMSSVLDVRYKKPTEFGGSVELSMLGAQAHVGGIGLNKRLTYLAGFRQWSNQYILNALPTEGQYRPSFTDFQTYLTYKPHIDWEIEAIGYIARNVYRFVPVSSETSFGTFSDALKLQVYFDGQERDKYENLMGGLAATWQHPNNKLRLKWMTSAYTTAETEAYDIIGQYFIGEVEKNLGEEDFGDITRILGVGTYHDWARNKLSAVIANAEHRGYANLKGNFLSWGVKYQHEQITDKINEWYRLDSAGYNLPQFPTEIQLAERLRTQFNLNSNRLSGFVQDEWQFGNNWSFTGGARFNYWDLNNEFFLAPRLQVAWSPKFKAFADTTGNASSRSLLFRLAAGAYHQPAFYREMRSLSGELNTNLLAQKSAHVVLGADYNFEIFDRPFKLTAEAYYKYIWDLVPYNIENVLIRYFANNNAKGYAAGLDMRLYGEFVKGTDSWISLSVMQTREDLENDFYYRYFNEEGQEINPRITGQKPADSLQVNIGYVPRPTDQRVNFGMFFQDYLPNNKNFKVNLSLLFGSGLSFSPPGSPKLRNAFRVPPYRRIDIGFSALLFDRNRREIPERNPMRHFSSVWAAVEVFNLLGINNTISYNFIRAQDLVYAVPNYLTARRLNVRMIVKF
ncbi:MAG TPA: TonB-dependent receptor [Chitinophagales bacterium]|nr:TonB-dependent receptor [Chitinophagales bacterium]